MSSSILNAQIHKKELFRESENAFYNEQFQKALGLLLQYDSIYPDNYVVKYRIGACYLNTRDEKTKAMPYLDYVYKKNMKSLPPIVVRQLADFYFNNKRFDDAEKLYKRYLQFKTKDKKSIKNKLKVTKYHKTLKQDSLKANILNIGSPVNTLYSETMPLVSADGSKMYYQEKFSEKVYVALNRLGVWSEKHEVSFPNLDKSKYSVIKLAGISATGDRVFMQLGNWKNTDLYVSTYTSDGFEKLELLDSNINSPYHEDKISLSANEQTIYFSSNRPGGYGKYDIYKSEKDDAGNWGKPVNLGANINSSDNESYPFIRSNMKTLYFCSDNKQKSLGGYDIFHSKLEDGKWSEAQNIGHPINTRMHETSYSVTSDGSTAYFSSIRNDIALHYDIYSISLKDKTSLMTVKGRILAGIPPEPTTARIKVFDKESGTRLKYIYPPNPLTGKYLMVFPSGKEYDMHITAEGYQPYTLNLDYPKQLFFQENIQEIYLRPAYIDSLGNRIEEKIIVKDKRLDFYNTNKYNTLLRLIEKLIETTDSLGLNALDTYAIEDTILEEKQDKYTRLFNLVTQAIETEDTLALRLLEENTIPDKLLETNYNEDGDLVPPMRLENELEYRVQIVAGIKHLHKKDSFFKSKEVVYYSKKGHILRYFIKKSFSNLDAANKFKSKLIKEGFLDAFVVKFINGESID